MVIVFIIVPEIDIAVPVFVGGGFAVLQKILKGEKAAAGMIKDPVYDDFQTDSMAVGYIVFEFSISSKAVIHLAVVGCFVAMSLRLEEGADIDGGAANLFCVISPGFQLFKLMAFFNVIFVGASTEAKRIYVIENSAVIPGHSYCTNCDCSISFLILYTNRYIRAFYSICRALSNRKDAKKNESRKQDITSGGRESYLQE